jgi:hypothetical protein
MPLALQAFRYSGMTRQSCNSFSCDPYIIKDSSYPEDFSIFSKVFSFPVEVYLPALSDCFFWYFLAIPEMLFLNEQHLAQKWQ